MDNCFGLVKGRFIGEPPAYVNKALRPGSSAVPKPTVAAWLQNAPLVLITSPNFLWACMALLLYGFFPYQLGADSTAAVGPISFGFFVERFPIWSTVTLGYAAFWHIALYFQKLASRPFIQARTYSWDKVAHNVLWTTSGIAIWTCFENSMCYLWSSGRLSYITDTESFGSMGGMLAFIVALMAVPLWRSFHFYWAHRFLHMDAVYKLVHSLHHRNTDVEPFSGLCMHPVEHLYYFACMAPSLLFYCSPFAFLWNGVHLLLSPAASHSGYEDHFQSDVFHYMHHRYFECNYAGTDAAFMDLLFGTFRESFDEVDQQEDPAPREDAKSTVLGYPSAEFLAYGAASGICMVPAFIPTGLSSLTSSILAGLGPVAVAPLVAGCFGSRRGVAPVKMTTLGNSIHVVMGFLCCCLPIAYLCWLCQTEK
jgi:sterol desaturase/sphingolipid hydroxylase (fatty acid hydroxylase superfamily)